MSDVQVCPICGMTLHNCTHSIETMIKHNNKQIDALIAERDKALEEVKQLKQVEQYADELFADCNRFMNERDVLRQQLDVAIDAMKMAKSKFAYMGEVENRPDCEACAVSIEFSFTDIAKLGEKK